MKAKETVRGADAEWFDPTHVTLPVSIAECDTYLPKVANRLKRAVARKDEQEVACLEAHRKAINGQKRGTTTEAGGVAALALALQRDLAAERKANLQQQERLDRMEANASLLTAEQGAAGQ